MIRARRHRRSLGALALAGALLACDMPVEPVLTPVARPVRAPDPSVPVQTEPTSAKSAELRAYFASVQRAQLSQGLLRQDGGGPDTPFTPDMLARNFRRIAFFNEYGGAGIGVSGRLRRWEDPVRMKVLFGPSVPPSQRSRDAADVRSYAARLSRATGHPITLSERPNFLVYFVSEDDRADTISRTAPAALGLSESALRPILSLGDDIYCAVLSFARGPGRSDYVAAVAVIRAENPDLLRLSCIHEELAQGLGLANDSPSARPSIFNDDDEFALLTGHDEILLGLLYDARLRTGMTLPEATPVIRILAREALQGEL
ncbi:MAG: DUF2927 domain-containing protein [Pseudomonadota bacterium]